MTSFYTVGVVRGGPSGLESSGGSRASMRCQFCAIDAPAEYELQPGESSCHCTLLH
jgi:hypothetical protein